MAGGPTPGGRLTLPFLDAAVLAIAALLTSILSGVIGMAGGITLLAVMLLYLEPLLAIPLHGVVQLVSNSTRTVIQRRHVRWPITGRFAVFLLPAAWLGLQVAQGIPPDVLKAVIGAFVLLCTWRPTWLLLGTHPEAADPRRRFLGLGGAIGFLSVTVGATGPLLAPFFLNLGLPRQGIVGTKAACQLASHLAKIAVFGAAGFAFGAHAPLLLLLCAAVIVGTWIGSRLLESVNERAFTWLYKGVLTAVAVRLVLWDGLRPLVAGGMPAG